MSISRPGVAISTSTPRISTSFWSDMLSPPMISAWVSFRYLPYWTKFSATCKREFARRLQDQAARHARPGAGTAEDIQHRQGEAGGLAGAGLRGAHHVAAHQHERDRLFLDRRRVTIAHLGDRAQHLLGQAEIGEHGPRRLVGLADGLRLRPAGVRTGRVFARRVVDRFRRGGRAVCQFGSSRWFGCGLLRNARVRGARFGASSGDAQRAGYHEKPMKSQVQGGCAARLGSEHSRGHLNGPMVRHMAAGGKGHHIMVPPEPGPVKPAAEREWPCPA